MIHGYDRLTGEPFASRSEVIGQNGMVATSHPLATQIGLDILKNGGNAILTSKFHKTGTDRIYEALKLLNKKDIDLIMNVQGDEPDIEINDIRNLNLKMIINKSKIGTLAAKINNDNMFENENIVKVKIKEILHQNTLNII